MNFAAVDKIARTVLYEGHILYPYRTSAKNHQRFTFGSLFPQAYAHAHALTDPCSHQAQCVLQSRQGAEIEVAVRFLHPVLRTVGEVSGGWSELPTAQTCWHPVSRLEIDGQLFESWQETVEREIRVAAIPLDTLRRQPRTQEFAFPARRTLEPLRDAVGRVVGIVLRQQQALAGRLELSVESSGDELFVLTARVLNETPMDDAGEAGRDDALAQALVAAQTLMGVRGGRFVSLIDPPPDLRAATERCRNVGVWPVLVGEEEARDMMLAAPIILYDYPRLAPESPGDLFDATEIDEILTLRILSLTPAEMREAAALDPQARDLLRRSQDLAQQTLRKLHGTLRRPGEDDHE
jgi:hypothetical protein